MSHLEHDPIDRLNAHHAADLLAVAQAFGHPDATAAAATGIDSRGVALVVDTPRGPVKTRVAFVERAERDRDLRLAFRALAALARGNRTTDTSHAQ